MDFLVGQIVRSYDFPDSPNRAQHYVEGVFMGVCQVGRYAGRYMIRGTKIVRDGVVFKDANDIAQMEEEAGQEYVVFPPPNGIQNWMGGVTNGVEAV